MITCQECIERMKPNDPRVKSGRYYLCGCDYCNKPHYFRELEQTKPKPEIPDIPDIAKVSQLQSHVEQARAGYLYLQNKLNKHLDKKKRSRYD